MAILKLNPYYSLPTNKDPGMEEKFHLNVGDLLLMPMFVGYPIVVTDDDRRREIDLIGLNAKMEASIYPDGEEKEDFVLVEVAISDEVERTEILWCPFGLEYKLVAILTFDDEDEFPFTHGQIISIPLKVWSIDFIHETKEQLGWHLVPDGEEIDGLIHTEVALLSG